MYNVVLHGASSQAQSTKPSLLVQALMEISGDFTVLVSLTTFDLGLAK